MTLTRRRFLGQTAAAAGALVVPAPARLRPLGANGDLRVAVVGLNGRGGDHVRGLRALDGVRVVALCDADEAVLGRAAAEFDKREEQIARYVDYRKLLEDAAIDAVSIATPNHWHSLMAVWACQAGKDVYLEKPVSHNVSEGRKVVAAAHKHGRIVACGTQSRSNPGMRELMAFLHEGGIGKIRAARGLCYKPRPSIGRVDGEGDVPKSVDYDLWTGPAPLEPLRRKRLHYDWHWVWPTGNGDLGNQGIHQMDLCRWALGESALAPRVLSLGARLGYDDDGETFNTQLVVHDYAAAPLIFEVRGLPRARGERDMDRYQGVQIGAVIHGEAGTAVIGGYDGGQVLDADGKVVRTFKGGGDHYANFVGAVRSRKESELTATILDGHVSSALCHVGNISCLLGAGMAPDAMRERISEHAFASEALGRTLEHLERNGVDAGKTPLRLGQWLEMDPKTERFAGNEAANALLTRAYRAPFTMPEEV
jgi:predicted dehydrogenase